MAERGRIMGIDADDSFIFLDVRVIANPRKKRFRFAYVMNTIKEMCESYGISDEVGLIGLPVRAYKNEADIYVALEPCVE
jgi:hypothetical protein